jgi:tyrosyl-tRNA synthetase
MDNDFYAILKARGFVHQCTNEQDLSVLSRAGAAVPYIGFDLTADSLHVGSLIQLMVLRIAHQSGITPTVLFGTFTSRVGDPTGRRDARPMLNTSDLAANLFGIENVINRILGSARFHNVTNSEWLQGMSLIDYLTEYAPHFSVNRMLTMDSVRDRLETQSSMSVLEFNYSSFQAIDFLHLNGHGCNLQIGGSDQWSNIISGIDLIRRKKNRLAFGLTTPLLTNVAGEKMGKSAGGAVWLSKEKTPVGDFWQFWRNVEDAKVRQFLGLFTDLPMAEVERLGALAGAEINEAKKILATEVTKIVHGDAAANKALRDATAVFEKEDFSNAPLVQCDADMVGKPVSALIAHVTKESKSQAVRLINQKAVLIDNKPFEADVRFGVEDGFNPSEPFVLRVGKNRVFRIAPPQK